MNCAHGIDMGGSTPGFLCVDPYREDADVQRPMWDTQLPCRSFNLILASHSLEHVPVHMVEQTLSEFYRLLMDGGEAIIIVPDIAASMRKWAALDSDLDWPPPACIYGNQKRPGMYHTTAFRERDLQKLLGGSGFASRTYQVPYPTAWTYGATGDLKLRSGLVAIGHKPHT